MVVLVLVPVQRAHQDAAQGTGKAAATIAAGKAARASSLAAARKSCGICRNASG